MKNGACGGTPAQGIAGCCAMFAHTSRAASRCSGNGVLPQHPSDARTRLSVRPHKYGRGLFWWPAFHAAPLVQGLPGDSRRLCGSHMAALQGHAQPHAPSHSSGTPVPPPWQPITEVHTNAILGGNQSLQSCAIVGAATAASNAPLHLGLVRHVASFRLLNSKSTTTTKKGGGATPNP